LETRFFKGSDFPYIIEISDTVLPVTLNGKALSGKHLWRKKN
jgi:hypothetical protein